MTRVNGDLALWQLHEQRRRLLCDPRMPGLDGVDFYDMLSHQHAYLRKRVLFLLRIISWEPKASAFLEQCGQPWCTNLAMLRTSDGHTADAPTRCKSLTCMKQPLFFDTFTSLV